MSIALLRHAKLEDVVVEQVGALDRQGMPSYSAPVTIQARVIREDVLVPGPAGQEVTTALTLWIPSSQTPVPRENDRITYRNRTYIGVELEVPKYIRSGMVSHSRLRCREELG